MLDFFDSLSPVQYRLDRAFCCPSSAEPPVSGD